MGMTSAEYCRITYHDLMLKIDGFQEREQYMESMFRRVGFSAHVGSHIDPKTMPKTIAKYWPMRGDKQPTETYSFQDKKEAFRELLEMVQHGASRN